MSKKTTIGTEEARLATKEYITQEIDEVDTFETPYGSKLGNKPSGTIRIGVLNVKKFPLRDQDASRHDLLKTQLTKHNFDCIGLNELNWNWGKLGQTQQLHSILKRWPWESSATKTSYIKSDYAGNTQQIGGTATIITEGLTTYIKGRGEDERGMGRWSWMTLSSDDEKHKVSILTLYHPCNSSERMLGSAKMQQLRHLRKHYKKDTSTPHQAFQNDLKAQIQKFKKNGNEIIIMGDFNQDITQNTTLTRLLKAEGLKDAIYGKYGGNPPQTYKWGSHPIDAIYTSSGINITQGGYKQGDIQISDHRLLWIDIQRNTILGAKSKDLPKPSRRQLHSSNPRVRKKYNALLETHLIREKTTEKAKRLNTIVNKKEWNQEATELYEQLDNIRHNAIKFAEKRCKKKRQGNVSFSDVIHRAMGKITMWKLILARNYQTGKRRPRLRYLQRKAKKWKFGEDIGITDITRLKKEIIHAEKMYRLLRPNARALRHSFLEEKAKLLAEDSGKDVNNHYIQLRNSEETKEAHQRIKASQQGGERGALVFIEEEQPDGTRKIITDTTQMEDKIREANEQKLQQCNNTPLREEPLCSFFNEKHLDFKNWEKALNPEADIPTNIERGTNLWIKEMQREDNTIPPTDIKMDADTYLKSWTKMKESTSSHIGIHFGHLKAMHPNLTPHAAYLHATMARIPMRTGYTPKRWKACTNTMLKKKANDMRPEKLRLVTLMEACFNHNNKMIGKTMMAAGEQHGFLAPEQYGSRKHKSAGTHALNKVLTLDISRQTKTPMVVTANDARSCYDRIILMATYLAMIKFGITRESAQSMITAIAELEHYIRTGKGDSHKSYGGKTWIRLPHGIGQGNGAGPGLWACVSTPLFEILRKEGYGGYFKSPITGTIFSLVGFAFVDDADLLQTGHHGEPIQNLVTKAQNQLTLWEEVLRATGGAVEPGKSDWLLISYRWKDGNWSYGTKYKGDLEVRDKDKNIKALKQLSAHEARETLGVWICGDGSWKAHTKHLKNKTTKWGYQLKRSFLDKQDSRRAIKTTILMTLKYSLQATYMSQRQCNRIMSPLLTNALPKLGVIRTMRRTAVHLPCHMNGLGIPDLYILQGIDHIKVLLDHGGQPTATGELLQNTIETHMLETGSSNNFFSSSPNELTVMTLSWMKQTLQFLQEYNITMDHNITPLQKWKRTHDTIIMNTVYQSSIYTEEQTKQINQCRMYLRVITLSDITHSDGRPLRKIWEVKKGIQTISAMAYRWPIQGEPTQEAKQLWRDMLQREFHLDRGQTNPLIYSEGLNTSAAFVGRWMFDSHDDTLWEKSTNLWQQWKPISRRTRTSKRSFRSTTKHTTMSRRHWRIAIVEQTGNVITIHTTHNRAPPETSNHSRPKPWMDPPPLEPSQRLQDFADSMKNGTAKTVSDGSYKDYITTAAYKALQGTPSFQSTVITPGRAEDQCAYRGELAGLLGIIMMANMICTYFSITHGKITVGCDNTTALWNSFEDHPITSKHAQRDILQAIRHALQRSPLHWIPKHVKGHQDDTTTNLDEWAQGNVDVDKMATECREAVTHIPPHTRLEGEQWRLLLHGQPIVSKVFSSIEWHCYIPIAKSYWEERGRINQGYADHVDWTTVAKATRSTPQYILQYITKLYAGFGATGVSMNRRGHWAVDQCPRCGETETSQHIFQCSSPTASTTFANGIGEIDDWVRKTSTDDMADAIFSLITDYREGTDQTVVWDTWSPLVKAAVKHQTKIGPRSFVEGALHNNWVQAQQQAFLLENKTRHSPTKWVATLISKLWVLQHKMWLDRNCTLHQTETQTRLHQPAILLDLHNLLQNNDQTMPAIDRRLFVPFNEAAHYSLAKQRRLASQLRAAIDAHAHRASTPEAQCMRRWLSTAATMSPPSTDAGGPLPPPLEI